jgi:TolB protein
VGTYAGKTEGAYLLNLESGARRELPGINNGGVFSKDASRILVAVHRGRGYDIVEHTIATGAQTNIAPNPAPDFLATYSPDGRSILFNSYRTGKSDIYLVPQGGGEPIRLTDFEGYDAHADFSADMKRIVFHRNVGSPGHDDYDIYQIDFTTRAVAPLITGPGEQAYPAFSPDGNWIAYSATSDEGKNDIFVAASDGSKARRLTRTPGYNAYPSWSGDGAFVYFNDERGGKRNVYRLAFDGAGGCRQ